MKEEEEEQGETATHRNIHVSVYALHHHHDDSSERKK